jgi:hypothetical protein
MAEPFSYASPFLQVYLNDGDKEEDFLIKGNFRAKHFEIIQKVGGHERQIAGVKKESKFSSATAFLKSQLTESDKYFVTIEAGVDCAFVVALAILCDELFQDKPAGGGY